MYKLENEQVREKWTIEKRTSYGRIKTIIGGFVMPREYRLIKQYENELLDLRNQGLTYKEIADRMGFSKKQIEIFEENIKSFVTNQITLLKAKCEYKHLPSAIKEANWILDYSSMNNTNINTDISYLRAREGLDINIKRSELPLRNE